MRLDDTLSALSQINVLNPLPDVITKNLRQTFELRPYQIESFRRFSTYFEKVELRRKPAHVLFILRAVERHWLWLALCCISMKKAIATLFFL